MRGERGEGRGEKRGEETEDRVAGGKGTKVGGGKRRGRRKDVPEVRFCPDPFSFSTLSFLLIQNTATLVHVPARRH